MNADEHRLEAAFRVICACPRPKISKTEKSWFDLALRGLNRKNEAGSGAVSVQLAVGIY